MMEHINSPKWINKYHVIDSSNGICASLPTGKKCTAHIWKVYWRWRCTWSKEIKQFQVKWESKIFYANSNDVHFYRHTFLAKPFRLAQEFFFQSFRKWKCMFVRINISWGQTDKNFQYELFKYYTQTMTVQVFSKWRWILTILSFI